MHNFINYLYNICADKLIDATKVSYAKRLKDGKPPVPHAIRLAFERAAAVRVAAATTTASSSSESSAGVAPPPAANVILPIATAAAPLLLQAVAGRVNSRRGRPIGSKNRAASSAVALVSTPVSAALPAASSATLAAAAAAAVPPLATSASAPLLAVASVSSVVPPLITAASSVPLAAAEFAATLNSRRGRPMGSRNRPPTEAKASFIQSSQKTALEKPGFSQYPLGCWSLTVSKVDSKASGRNDVPKDYIENMKLFLYDCCERGNSYLNTINVWRT